VSESEEELIGRWDATLAEAGPDATSPELTFQPPGWGGELSGGTAGLPGLTLSGLPDAAVSTSGQESSQAGHESSVYDKTVQLPEAEMAAGWSGPGAGTQGAGHESSVYDKTVQLPDGGSSGTSAFDATQAPPDPNDSSAQTQAGAPFQTSAIPGEAPLYTLEEVIGRGGMGVVYRAYQGSLQRSVALKRQIGVSSDAGRRRFVAEAVATGRLDHPNIVPVYDLGTDPTGEVVLTMKLVDGIPWKNLLHPSSDEDRERAKGYQFEDHLRILVQVSNAIAFAHSRHIVHNDLKPENVMLGEFGEVLVMDWGLAVHIGDASEETAIPHKNALQAPCGTPAYMPPELADGEGERIGPWTDGYLLGAILHEIVTGGAPHKGTTLHEVIVAAVRSEPPTFGPEVSSELAELCKRAMAKDPQARFPDVVEFREALETYLTHRESHVAAAGATTILEGCDPARLSHEQLYAELGEAIARYGQALELWSENLEAAAGRRRARLRFAECALGHGDLGLADAQLGYLEPSDAAVAALRTRISAARDERLREERLQGQLRLGLVVTVGLFVIGLVAGLALLKREAERTALRAEEARAAQTVAETARGEAEAARHVAEGLAAMSLVGQGDALLTGGRPAEASRRFREALSFFKRLGRSPVSAELGLLSARRQSASPLIRHTPHEGAVTGVGFGRLGVAYTCGADGRVFATEPLGSPRELASGLGSLRALAVSPVGSWIAVGGEDGRVHLVPPQGGEVRLLADLPGQVEALASSIDGEHLICGASEPYLTGWRLPSGEPIPNFPSKPDVHQKPVTGIATSFNYLWLGDAEGRLVRWNAIRGQFAGGGVHWDYSRRWPRWLPRRPLRALWFSDNQPQLAFAIGTQVQVWHHTQRVINAKGEQKLFNNYSEHFRLEGHHAPVSALSYVAGTQRLVTGGQDGRILAWDVASKTVVPQKDLPTHPQPIASAFANQAILSLASSPDGALVAAGHDDGSVSIWDLGLAQDLRSGAERMRQPLRFVEPPDPPAALQRPSPRNLRADVEPPALSALALGPEGNLAASGSDDGTLTLYDARGGRRLEHLNWHSKRILALELGQDELVSVCADGWVRNWKLETLTSASEAAVGSASAAAISSGRAFVALGRSAGGVEVFDARTCVLAWRAPGTPATALAVSAAGDAILSATAEGLSYIERGGARVSLESEQPITALALQGGYALAGDRRGHLTLYRVPRGEVVARRRAHGSEIRSLRIRGGRVFSVGGDGSWQLHDLDELTPIRSFRPEIETVETLAVDRTGRRVLVAGREVELWDLGRVREEDALSADLARQTGPERELALGRSLIVRGQLDRGLPRLSPSKAPDDSLRVALAAWELDRLELAHRAMARSSGAAPAPYLTRLREALARERSERCSLLGKVEGRIRGVWIDAKGERAITAAEYGSVDLWDLVNERRITRLVSHGYGLLRLAVDPTGKRFAIGDRKAVVELWQVDPPLRLRRWENAQRGQITNLCFGPGGDELYVSSYGKTFRVLSTSDGSVIRDVKTPKDCNGPKGFTVSPDGEYLAAHDGRRTVFLWRTRDFELVRWSYHERRSGLMGLTFTPRGLVAFRSSDRSWLTYSLEGELLETSRPGPHSGYAAAVDPERRRAVVVTTGRGEHPVSIWDLKTGEVVDSFPSLEGNLHVDFGPRGQVVLGGVFGRVTQWSPRQ
jgi:WD40 repeat protein